MYKDYTKPTEAQRLRDLTFLQETYETFVCPLVEDINTAIPGYNEMEESEKFYALMVENDRVGTIGNYLPLNFGNILRYGDVAIINNAAGYVFNGDENSFATWRLGDVDIRTPLFQATTRGVLDYEAAFNYNIGFHVTDGFGFREAYFVSQPIAFRVAIVAQYIMQNVFVSFIDACRFAAGWTSSIDIIRSEIRPVHSELGQLFGWSIQIRDTRPENEFVKLIASNLRANASDMARCMNTVDDFIHEGPPVSSVSEYELNKRSHRETTQILTSFIEDRLPSLGLHVGRNGPGEQISWKKAFEMFNDEHPGIYKSHTSFKNSYMNYKSRG